jgi:hypothetical protein
MVEWPDRGQQEDFTAVVTLLMEHGPQLPFPYSSGIEGSKHDHMRELRVQTSGKPLRGFYAFDPRRTAILLIGGDKTGDNRFYERMIPVADRIYDDNGSIGYAETVSRIIGEIGISRRIEDGYFMLLPFEKICCCTD